MPTNLSLRARLLVIILIPLGIVSIAAAYWRITTATTTAQEIFDRNLEALTLAISRDIVVSGGDVISDSTRELLTSRFGGTLYYHVYGPDGSFVTGYASPPVTPDAIELKDNQPVLFESVYRDEPVRVARLREHADFVAVSGFASVTVWQTLAEREAFVRQQATQAIILIASLFLTVAVVIWFGIKLGLKPLTDLQEAIAQRSTDDLSTIRRPVPPEVTGLVATLNSLLGQVEAAIASRDRFISDAAHQLRNPIAGILSLAQAAHGAKSPTDREIRVGELVESARRASRLTNQLLSLERAKGRSIDSRLHRADLNRIARTVCERSASQILEHDIDLVFEAHDGVLDADVDEILLEEAIQNLIDNSVKHGGPENSEISVRVSPLNGSGVISVSDNGAGISAQDSEVAFSRFGQVESGEGSGLGLAIVKEIAELHGGGAQIEPSAGGARISFSIPLTGHMEGD